MKRSEFGKEYVKLSKDGDFQKCKARWVQDKQKNTQQTDSLAASRAGFRCATQLAANHGRDLFHMDLKTAFLQGEAYDETRDIICQVFHQNTGILHILV